MAPPLGRRTSPPGRKTRPDLAAGEEEAGSREEGAAGGGGTWSCGWQRNGTTRWRPSSRRQDAEARADAMETELRAVAEQHNTAETEQPAAGRGGARRCDGGRVAGGGGAARCGEGCGQPLETNFFWGKFCSLSSAHRGCLGVRMGKIAADGLTTLDSFLLSFPGFCVSAAKLGLPDVGLISYGEMVAQARLITEAVSIPVVGDGDNGYGNSMNIKRTIKGYINAGLAAIMLEDQVSPKSCGHTEGKKVYSREQAVMHIKAAVDARNESGSDLVIIGRTDSRQAISLDEALARAKAFADAGADVLLIDALASVEEMKKFCAVAPGVPKMINIIEGGKTPILSPPELAKIGYSLIIYSVSLLGASIRAMEDALDAIKDGGVPPPTIMPSFKKIKDVLGFDRYYKEDKQYQLE